MSNITVHDRSYVVTEYGTLERMIGRRIISSTRNSNKHVDEKCSIKVIYPEASAASIAKQASYKGKYVSREPFNSMNLRDHCGSSKMYRPDTHNSVKTFSLNALTKHL